jgi:hypothetical protein
MSSERIIMGEACSSRPFAKMVEKFKQKQGHKIGNRKHIKRKHIMLMRTLTYKRWGVK